MNADTIVKAVLGALVAVLGAFVALLSYLGGDAMKRLHHLEGDTVRKSDWEALKKQLRDEHVENRETIKAAAEKTRDNIKELTDAVTGTHRRIDEFMLKQLELAKK
ncbi:MAG TPA: hypothetical protein VGG49_13320 [Steroidobacteraceae bacterium]